MLFSSYPFLFIFLPLALAGFYLAARLGHRAAAYWLVLISLAFYSYWRIDFLLLLLISIAFNYSCSQFIITASRSPRLQSLILLIAIIADLLALFYFKYAVALFSSLGLHTVAGRPFDEFVLPLGISFFTFTQIGFLVDLKQGVAKTRDFLSYVLFVTFFPHLIAGPILHHKEMMPQFADSNTYKLNSENIAIGSTIFILGLAKKVVFADPLASDVAASFGHAGVLGLTDAWYGVISYSLQLYFDFSGYSDMAIGLARIFNVRFPVNFNSPFKATTVIDYWQRWHMTLTRFITMYIFSPLALRITRVRAARQGFNPRKDSATIAGFAALVVVPTFFTMGLAGIWHGAGTQFLIFGLLHGFYLSVNHACRIFLPKRKSVISQPWGYVSFDRVWKVLAVYLSALVAFVFFRSSSTSAAFDFLSGMVGLHGLNNPEIAQETPVRLFTLMRLLVLLAIVWIAPNTIQIMNQYEPAIGRRMINPINWSNWNPNIGWSVLCGSIFTLCIVLLGKPAVFLYFQF